MKYAQEQIDYVIEMRRKKGFTSSQIHKQYNKRYPKEKRSEAALRRVYSRYGTPVVVDEKQSNGYTLDELIMLLVEYTTANNHVPSHTEYRVQCQVPTHTVKALATNYANLEKLAREKYPEIFAKVIDDTMFTQDTFDNLSNDIRKYNRFVITTAVTGCTPHEAGLAAIQSYCKLNKAKLLILPCSDPAKTTEHKYKFSLHHSLPQDSILFREMRLNENLTISDIKLSAKQIQPLTGLRRMGRKGSCIFASPKQMLEHVASSNKKEIPRALMTTGAITVSDYSTDLYMSERTAYIANVDHKLGAIVVEIKDNKTFFYRRIEIDPETGAFHDLNKRYEADGFVEEYAARLINQPDWHTLTTDPEFREVAKEIVELLQPETVTFEDFFDGYSINPHERANMVLRDKKHRLEGIDLAGELRFCAAEIGNILKWDADFDVVFKYGNHEDFLARYLSTAAYANDPANHYEGVCLAKAMLENKMPFEYAMRERYNVPQQDRLTFLRVNDSFIVNGIENGVHGHIGSGGKRNPTLAGLEAYGPCTTGHNHSAGILRDVVRIGTATYKQLVYNDGASSWTQTLCIQHYDGARQLITNINGEWCLPDILEPVNS